MRRVAAMFLCLLLVLQLSAAPVSAADTVFFTAAEENVLPLEDGTMPFWSGGYLYIPSTLFTGAVRKDLDVSLIPPDITGGKAILYRDSSSLTFDPKKSYAQDTEGNTYYPGTVKRHGVLFVPASTVAEFFGLQYSVLPVSGDTFRGSLVWLRKPGSPLTDKTFADAAYFPMASRYADYRQAKEQAARPAVPVPDRPPAKPDKPPEETYRGRIVYLCIRAEDPVLVTEFLNILDRYDARAAFYCTPDFLEEQGDLLRRMTATGQSVGILAQGTGNQRMLERGLEEANDALERAACTRTRLVFIQGGSEAERQAAAGAGYRCLVPELDRSGDTLRSRADARTLAKKTGAFRYGTAVWLDGQVTAPGLRAFLSMSGERGDVFRGITETA